jgi:hypothetical protein
MEVDLADAGAAGDKTREQHFGDRSSDSDTRSRRQLMTIFCVDIEIALCNSGWCAPRRRQAAVKEL